MTQSKMITCLETFTAATMIMQLNRRCRYCSCEKLASNFVQRLLLLVKLILSVSVQIAFILGVRNVSQSQVEARIIRHTWNVSYVRGYPDGVFVDHVLAINGRFPGPTVEGRVGDVLKVKVINKIQDGQNVTIHWHGLHQNGSPFEDGPSQITQCPIKQGSYQIYSFPLMQSGTYWYHSHVNSQYTEGLWGSLIVRNNPETYERRYSEEILITLSDWYHTSARQNERWYLSKQSGGAPPYPFSVLINGLGRYPCRYASRECRRDLQYRPKYHLQKDKVYRLRLINSSAWVSFNFTIEGHTLKTIEVDGVNTEVSRPKSAIFISAGQRYSFLLSTYESDLNRGRSTFLVRAALRKDFLFRRRDRPNINPNPDEIFEEVTGSIEYSRRQSPVGGREDKILLPYRERFDHTMRLPRTLNWNNLVFLQELEMLPHDGRRAPNYFDRQFFLTIRFKEDENGIRRGSFNGRPMQLPSGRPLLAKMVRGERIPERGFPRFLRYGDIIQVVINNPENGTHPIHLHGHNFWVMGQGHKDDGDFNPLRHRLSHSGHRRDTILIKERSWLVIRFRAHNIGVWTLHCHIDWHNLSGMAMTFVEAPEHRNRIRIPEEARRVCADHGIQI